MSNWSRYSWARAVGAGRRCNSQRTCLPNSAGPVDSVVPGWTSWAGTLGSGRRRPAASCRPSRWALIEIADIGPAELQTSADIAAIAGPRIGRARTEQVLLLFADGAHRLTRVITVATGGAISSALPVREVLALSLRHDAVAFAVAHNHPSGAVEPSAADLTVTRRLREAADQVGLRLLDHVIVAGDRWCSITASR